MLKIRCVLKVNKAYRFIKPCGLTNPHGYFFGGRIMTEIEKARETINGADKEIAKLFEKRMRAVEAVFDYKREHGLPIYDGGREQEVIAKNSAYIDDEVLRGYYIDFLKDVMDISKRYQSRLQKGVKIAYSGIKGAFAHIAAAKLYPDGNLISYPDFSSAYASVENGECDLAVLPIENSSAGEVGTVVDMIFGGTLYINGIYNRNQPQTGNKPVHRLHQRKGL